MQSPLAQSITVLITGLFAAACHGQTGYVKITSEPAEATIVVDGNTVGTTPKILELLAGRHNVTINKEFYSAVDRVVTIEADIVSKLHIRLQRGSSWIEEKPEDVSLSRGFGNLTVLTDLPNAEVAIDGVKTQSTTPLTVKKISAGRHVVTATLRGASAQQTVLIEPNQTKKVILLLKPVLDNQQQDRQRREWQINNPSPNLTGTWVGRRKCFYMVGRPKEELFTGRPVRVTLAQTGRKVTGLLQAFSDDYDTGTFREDFTYDGNRVTGQAVNVELRRINRFTHGNARDYKFIFDLRLTDNGNKLEGAFDLTNHSEGGFFTLERVSPLAPHAGGRNLGQKQLANNKRLEDAKENMLQQFLGAWEIIGHDQRGHVKGYMEIVASDDRVLIYRGYSSNTLKYTGTISEHRRSITFSYRFLAAGRRVKYNDGGPWHVPTYAVEATIAVLSNDKLRLVESKDDVEYPGHTDTETYIFGRTATSQLPWR